MKFTIDYILSQRRDLVEQYSLVVTGHSLGAGVAVLLTLLMKHSGYPGNICTICMCVCMYVCMQKYKFASV